MVGKRLRELRSTVNLTQEDLARLLGVSRQAICMWEANKRELRASMLDRIAKVFNVTVDELIQPPAIKAARKEATMATKGTKKKKVDFQLSAPEAKKVYITGDFNSWSEKGITMKKSKTGTWKTSVNLKPGRYEYKFIVDGQWWNDPTNDNTVNNSFGSTNSVVELW
ncbi:MAG: helix-turn-helix domain-containing protein [Candidatus Omnitrophica bacterium]|nr:helix-turn-helix domain-containing protein [Candidatus Omnitrophota bacterium]